MTSRLALLSPGPSIAQIAADAAAQIALCPACFASDGLCSRHKREILPQIAQNRRWLLLIGTALVEQRRRQFVSEHQAEVDRIKRRNARKSNRARARHGLDGAGALLAALRAS